MIQLLGKIRWIRNGSAKRIARVVMPFLYHPRGDGLGLEPVGDGEGAWVVPTSLVRPDWVCYCVGVGDNATLDVALATRFGCRVFSFDPTPRAIQYMSRLDYPRDRLTFLPYGVWNEDANLRFYAPANRAYVNHSVVDLHGTGEHFTAVCKRLSTIMAELGHSHVDLLKLDIEGSWREVLSDMLDQGLNVSVLCVEFDSPTSIGRMRSMIRRLADRGYLLVYFERENFVFVQRRSAEPRNTTSVKSPELEDLNSVASTSPVLSAGRPAGGLGG